MKKIMFILTTILILSVIMGSALKAREEEKTQIQTVINEEMNVAVVSEGNENKQVINPSTNKTVLGLKNILPEKYEERKLFKIKWTQNERNTGKELYCTQGSGACGPMGFALDTFNNIYILDIGCGIKKYNESGEFISIYKEQNYELSNMDNIEVSEDGKYMYGMNDEIMTKYIYIYNAEKRIGERIGEGQDYQYKMIPHGVEIYEGETLAKKFGGKTVSTESKSAEDKMKKRVENKYREIFRTNKLNMAKTYNDDYQVYNSLICYFIGKDRNNNYYISTFYTEKNPEFNKKIISKSIVYKYSETGELLSVIILADREISYLNYSTIKHLRVNRDGDVYYLCPKKDGAVIYKYESVK